MQHTRCVAEPDRSPTGQSSTLGFVETFNATAVNESADPLPVPAAFNAFWSLSGYTWAQVWTYRRLYAASPANPNAAAVGDFTLQNWDHGNDNSFAYLLLPRTGALLTLMHSTHSLLHTAS